MNDLVEFLRARLDEDEQAARATSAECWKAEIHHHMRTGEPMLYEVHPIAELEGYGDGGVTTAGDAVHIARHDPARVLREVEAKRQFLEFAVRTRDLAERQPTEGQARELRAKWSAYLTALKFYALPHADHPDYREEWRS